MAEQFNLKKFLIDNKLTKSTQLRDGRFGLLKESIESIGEKMDKTQFKQKVKEMILKEIDLTHRKKEINESVWSVLPERIPEFIKAVNNLKEEYHEVVGSDDVFDGLDRAIIAAEELMENSPIKEAKKDEEEVETEDEIEVTDEFEDTEGEDTEGEDMGGEG